MILVGILLGAVISAYYTRKSLVYMKKNYRYMRLGNYVVQVWKWVPVAGPIICILANLFEWWEDLMDRPIHN